MASEAGTEVHHKAGAKVVLDAGVELTISGGGSFIKLDPSGVTLSGPGIKINSGGAPGSGSGAKAQAPLVPHALDREQPEDPDPVVLPDVAQRLDRRPINVESQKAALMKGNATCAVCEMGPA